MIDGKLQSAEIDEFVYHESLVHPPLLSHPKYFPSSYNTVLLVVICKHKYLNLVESQFSLCNAHALIFSPKTIFIMGGGEGSTAREILRHKTVQKLVMCDIDQVQNLENQFSSI